MEWNRRNRIEELKHPCFGCGGGNTGRMHLPVAPKCNLSCGFCDRKHDCANESRPGQTSAVLTPRQAADRAREIWNRDHRIRIAGIAGPGEPLANGETFETLELLKGEMPELTLCLSTNGFYLPDCVGRLTESGVKTLTVTRNAVHVNTAVQIYDYIEGYDQREGCRRLLEAQREGLAKAVEQGLIVKVNVVYIPGINDGEIEAIAEDSQRLGAYIMNVMPLIPAGRMEKRMPPSPDMLEICRSGAGKHMLQFYHCRHCRADAAGML